MIGHEGCKYLIQGSWPNLEIARFRSIIFIQLKIDLTKKAANISAKQIGQN